MAEAKTVTESFKADELGSALSGMTDTDLDHLVSDANPNLKGKEDGYE